MLLMILACSSTKPSEEQNQDVVWYGDIQPFVAENCTTCHFEGGSSPFVLETLEQVTPLAPVMLSSMQSGSMPPWLPSSDCAPLEGDRSLTQEQIDRFAQWVEQGQLEGDPALGETPIPFASDIEPNVSAQMPPGFTPTTTNGDQYRCFPLALDLSQETFITQYQVKPGSSQVHHVLIYALDPSFKDSVAAADGQDGEIGYECFGTPFPPGNVDYSMGFPTQIGAWVPGIEPAIFPEGTALRIKPNSVPVMQIHYSALGGEPVEDTTSYHIVTTTEPPQKIAQTRPLAIQNLDIPPGATVSVKDTFTNYTNKDLKFRSLATHMHMIGTEQQATILRNSGDEECALNIEDWDFAWQQSYIPTDNMSLAPGETMEVRCTYDNSAENQPFVDGEQIAPAHVEWGDGSLDEMCILYTTTIEDYRPLPPQGSPACYGIEECTQECGDSLSCLLACDTVEFSCLTCTLGSFLDCGVSQCGIPALQAEECLRECYSKSIMMGSPIGSCLSAECPTEYEALVSCADPVIRDGECVQSMAECGLSFSD